MGRLVVLVLATVVLIAARAPAPAQLAGGAITGASSSSAAAVTCDGARAAIASLTDEETALLDFTPVVATVSDLRAIPIPEVLPRLSRIAPTELTTYTVSAVLASAIRDESGTIVLILTTEDDPSVRLTARLIDAAACAGSADEALLSRMAAACTAFIDRFGVPSTARSIAVSGTAHVTGVGHFASAAGASPRVTRIEFELHPVLDLNLED